MASFSGDSRVASPAEEAQPETRSVARELSTKSFETFVFRLFSQASLTILGIVLAREIGPLGKGIYIYAATILAILLTVSSGQSSAITWQYARQKMSSATVYAAMMRFCTLLVLPISIGLALFGLWRHDVTLIAPALALPFAYFNQVTLAFFLSDGHVRWANVQGLLVPGILVVAVVIACVGFHQNVDTVLVLWVLSFAVVGVRSFVLVRRYANRGPREENVWHAFIDQLKFASKASAGVLLQALNFQINLFLVSWILGATMLGVYSVAVGLGQLMWFISRPLAFSSYGRIASLPKRESARLTLLCLRHSIIAVGIASVLLFFIGPRLIVLLYGARFSGSALALRCILPGIVAYCGMPFVSQFYVSQMGRPMTATYISGVSTITCAAISLALIHPLGIAGCAIATSVSYSAAFGIMLFLFYKETNIAPTQIFAVSLRDLRHYDDLLKTTYGRIARLLRLKSA